MLRKFRQVSISEVGNPDLLAILQTVNNYWKDGLRPVLTSFSCEAVGGTSEMAIDAGVMFTLLSAGFGIHDDIIDRTSTKEYRKTIPYLYGADHALLAGDLLVLKASTMASQIIQANPSIKVEEMIKSYRTYYTEICESEFMALSCRGTIDIELETYINMLWKSTADTEACCRIGATLGNGSKQEVTSLAEFGRRLGFYRRLLSDVRDCLNIEGNLPSRLKNETVPLSILYATKSSKDANTKIQSIIAKTAITPEDFRQLGEICQKNRAFAYIHKIALKNFIEASTNLEILKPSLSRDALSLLNRRYLAAISRLCL